MNDFISKEASHLRYTPISKIIQLIPQAGRHCFIIKKDIKDAFRNIPVAAPVQWLLGLSWGRKLYQETCLFLVFIGCYIPSYLGWTDLEHYLDDFIRVLASESATEERRRQDNIAYCLLTDCLRVPRQDSKDVHGTVVKVFGLEVDTSSSVVRAPADKLARARQAVKAALSQSSVTLKEIASLIKSLFFCAQAVHWGWVFMSQLWDFVTDYPPSSEFT